MAGENLKRVVVATENYKTHGFSNIVSSGSGMTIPIEDYKDDFVSYNLRNYEKFVFEEALGLDFGKKDMFFESGSYGFLIEKTKEKLKKLLSTQRQVPESRYQDAEIWLDENKEKEYPNNRLIKYDDILEYFGTKYLINLRYDHDKDITYFIMFYERLNEFYDSGKPLYITVASIEDIENYK